MDSIGSVAAMYKRTSSATSTTGSDFANSEADSELGEQILACNGIQAYDDYCQTREAIKTAQHGANVHQCQVKNACKSAIRATAKRFHKIEAKIEMKLVGFVCNAIEKAVHRQPHL